MINANSWLATLHAFLELLYFASGVAIAVAAFFGLRQIRVGLEQVRLTKQIADTNGKREAAKLAAEQSRYFAEVAVPALSKLTSEYKRLGLTFLSNQPQFAIQNGEIVNTNFSNQLWDEQAPKLGETLVSYLNTMESFAILFAAGVADDDLGYQETARAFCQGVLICMPAFFHMRRINAARYESAIRLYDIWNKRLAAQALAPVMKTMEELIKSVERDKIRPLH
jgi:hypothetical protein